MPNALLCMTHYPSLAQNTFIGSQFLHSRTCALALSLHKSEINVTFCYLFYDFCNTLPVIYIFRSSYVSLQSIKMTIFLVDLEFREKIKHYLRPKEILFVVFFLFFALIPWVDVFNFVYTNMGGNATKFWEDLDVEVHCNPKFGKLCHQP